ncbi:DNA helicase II UvrD [Helicobacter sp. NHP19-012]|uniref:DNA 3'-5' helicase n=1 Tax=Helicobacter gastrofelis TaxID=2849642 RepID=A0ABN6I4I1_9HELI|nr:DNA helicase II UvrD [Helicobacter sp. NHP19-012]GMB95787.1 DNA helicase II UvrD [Helicobacter sp. NHP22-001]
MLHIDGPLLILAGAGSGKTKTLTTRLAYLIGSVGVRPENTLTLTFTKKAAHEMQERAMALLGTQHKPYKLKLSTFHSFGCAFLRKYMGVLGRTKDFIVKKPEELKKELKHILLPYKNNSNFPWQDDSHFLGHLFKNFLRIKNHLIKWEDCYPDVKKAFRAYGEYLEKQNWVDYDDLIALPHLILEETPTLARQISEYYQYISVDEYQDTNPLQFKLLKQLCSTHENLCVVGDDDQSIYGFRGADISNILDFQNRFPRAKVIKLEQNYRSTPEILSCANELIAHNQYRHQKTLFSQKSQGGAHTIKAKHFPNTLEEQGFILKKILECAAKGIPYEEIAILYRFNCLAEDIEKTLRQAKIPYTLVGQTGFFERAEIKDRLAYLRTLANPHDDSALLRLLSKVKGLGKGSVEKIQCICAQNACSIAKAYQSHLLQGLPSKAHARLQEFFTLLDALSLQATHLSKPKQALELFNAYAYMDDGEQTDEEVLERLQALKTMFLDFVTESLALESCVSVQDFLDQSVLETPAIHSKNSKGVKCMTVHASKGLEFSVVFLVGFEEGFFPYGTKEADIEEERRLGYVAITRAKEEFYICSTKERAYFRQKQVNLSPSRFVEEAKLAPAPILHVGDCVHHSHYGFGLIKHIEEGHLQVFFTHGLVWLRPNSVKKIVL